jgi:V/A-type H+-transporting ATPase subunit B
VLAAIARAHQSAELAELVGTAALSETDHSFITYRDLVERELFNQRDNEARSFEDTLGRAWRALAALPEQELTMLSTTFLDKYLPKKRGDHE